jgi:Putative peptidoglycan binding domain/N-acetylmuramoyl-L-alanine amidase
MLLKKGSSGPSVVLLQQFLKITADGDFGPKTESAVKVWQKANGLVADGIVGAKTWAAMGIATTDVSETSDSELPILKNYLPKGEYFDGPVPKRWLFLHHTAGWDDPNGAVSTWGYDNRGAVATEFVLGGQSILGNRTQFDGVLLQVFPRGGYGWHLGTGNDAMHRESVGIEVCNFGQLTKGGFHRYDATQKKYVWSSLKPNSFYTYVGTEAHPSQIVELAQPFRGFKFWHRYSDKQVEVLKEFILYIGNRDNIDIRKGIIEQIKSKGAVAAFDMVDIPLCRNTPGMWLHTNVMAGKVDLFPQLEVIDMLLSL